MAMNLSKPAAALVLAAVIGPSAVLAGPVQKEQVPAKAKWVAHADVDALVASGLGQYALAQIKEQGHDVKLQEFAEKFGFDLTKDLRSITLYGESYEPVAAVGVIRVKANKDKLLGLLAENEGHKESKYGDHVVHRWTEKPKGQDDDGQRFGAFHGEELVVVSRMDTGVKQALDVLDGKAASQAGEGATNVVPQPTKGALLVLACSEFKMPPEADPSAAVLKKLESGTAELGENAGGVFLSVAVTARTPEDANQIRQVVRGLVALGKIAAEHKEQTGPPGLIPDALKSLLANAVVGGTGTAANLRLAVPLKEIIDLAEREKARKAMKTLQAPPAAPAAKE